MATRKDPLIGRSVRVNDDALSMSGEPHPLRGQDGTVLKRNPHGNYQTAFGEQVVVLPLDSFSIAPSADAVHTSGQGDVAHDRLALLDHAAIVPSLTNPRKHFDHDFLQELAVSIKLQGIAQPILVRPLPGSRLEETSYEPLAPTAAWPLTRSKRDVRPTHEIVAGEQRWRSAAIAGVRRIPVLVRHLSDSEVLQLQLVENLKRRDLHPMEEAEGYERLRQDLAMSAEDIAERIGKGRSYVYKTLKLVDLVPAARQAFYDGKLTRSTAELLAMRPADLQPQVLKEITATDFHGDSMSFRKAKEHIDNHYMLKLGSAPFKITDETLVPAAGSCRTCPKRSGANPELFDDVAHADTCTDPSCFAGKKDAHYIRIRTEAEARGQTVITGREAKEIMPNSNTLRGYTKVDDHQALGGQMKTLRKVLGKDMPATTLLENPQTHEMVEVLPTAVVGQLLKQHGITKPETADGAMGEEESKRKGIEKFEKAWRLQAIEKTFAAISSNLADGVSFTVSRLLGRIVLGGLTADERKHSCKLLGLGAIAERDALEAHLRDCDDLQIEGVLFLLLMQHDMRELVSYQTDKATPAPHIAALAHDFDVDVAAVQGEVKKAFREALSEKRVADAAKAVKAEAKEVKPARKPKATAEETQAALVTALSTATNPNSFKAGDRVTVRIDLRRGTDTFKTAGTPADVVGPIGDRAWELQPDHLNFTLIADYTELEAIEP